MTARQGAAFVVVVASMALRSIPSDADEPSSDDDASSSEAAARDSTTPFPSRSTLTFKPSYRFPSDDSRYRAEIQVEPRFRYQGFFVPDVHLRGFASIARFQLSAINLEDAKGTAGGLGDLSFLDIVVHELGPLEIGVGFCSVFPMATSPALGKEKWQLGPALGLHIDTAEWLDVSVLTQVFWSFAGSSESATLAYATVQPLVTVHLGSALFVSSDATMNFFWAGGQSTVPVNLGFGHAFSEHFIGALVGEPTVALADAGALRLVAKLTYRP